MREEQPYRTGGIDHILPRPGQRPLRPWRVFRYRWRDLETRRDGTSTVFCLNEMDARQLIQEWDHKNPSMKRYEFIQEVKYG